MVLNAKYINLEPCSCLFPAIINGLTNPELINLFKMTPTELFFFLVFLPFLGPLSWHVEGPRLRTQSELLLPACARARATQDPSCICDLHHSSRQRRVPSPRSEARDQTGNLMFPSWICFHCARAGTPHRAFFRSHT